VVADGHVHRITTDVLGCPMCKRDFDVSRPIARQGWHRIHRCRNLVLEVLVMGPDEVPSAWRSISSAQARDEERSAGAG
jgi:hypothetical protein